VTRSRRAFLKAGGLAAGAAIGGWLLGRAKPRRVDQLRPPGAGEEGRFLSACLRCGQCLVACPSDILRLAGADSGVALGTPYFVPRDKPCDLCQGHDAMKCIASCPTGALEPVADRQNVRIGIAEIDRDVCLPWQGVICRACWHACPFPNRAITFDPRGRAVVVEDACVGCGLCEYVCPTEHPAIRVRSHATS
jgi:MauM/NapG family ferredoxin protein